MQRRHGWFEFYPYPRPRARDLPRAQTRPMRQIFTLGLALALLLSAGCGASGQAARGAGDGAGLPDELRQRCGLDARQSAPEGSTEDNADTLFRAMVAELHEQGMTLDACSAERRFLTTGFVAVNPELRRRYTGRVLTRHANVALNLNAVVQRRTVEEGQTFWFDVEDDREILRRKKAEEVELSRRIERRFHQLR